MNTPIPHRCAGLPENARAHIVTLPAGERVVTKIDCCFGGDGVSESWDTVTLSTAFCAGCGRPAEYLATVARADAFLARLTAVPEGGRIVEHCARCGAYGDVTRDGRYLLCNACVEEVRAAIDAPFGDPSAIEGWIGDKHFPAAVPS